MRLTAVCLSALLSSIHGAAALAQPAETAASIELPASIELRDFVELASERLDVSVQYKPEDLRRSVALRLQSPLAEHELWSVLVSVLEGQGLTVVETEHDGLYRVVPLANAAAENQRLLLDDELAGEDNARARFVSVLTRLDSVSAQQATAAIKPILSPSGGTATAIGADGLLLITDVRRRVEQALWLLEQIDHPADPVVSFVVDLETLSAAELIETMDQIAAAKLSFDPGGMRPDASRISPQFVELPRSRRVLVVAPVSQRDALQALIDDLDQGDGTEVVRRYPASAIPLDQLASHVERLLALTRTDGADPASQDSSLQIYADKLTQSLHVRGTPADHARVAEMIELLGESGAAALTTFRAFTIRNRDADDLVAVIESLIVRPSPQSLSAERSETFSSESELPSPPTRLVTNDDLTLTVDASTNTVLAIATRQTLQQLATLIEELDVRQPQVMIDVTLVSLTEGEAFDFGTQLRYQFNEGATEVNLASLFGLASGGDGSGSGFANGTGFTGVILNPGDFEVVIRALESVNRGRSMSQPRMLVNNNATSTLRAVASEPFTSLNASDTVATTSFGGTQDAGTTLTVTPHIAAGDHLILDYAVELSSFTGESTTTEGGGVVPPPSQQNSIDGSVTIPDDYTVVIGGIQNAVDGDSKTRVPILGSLPLIGPLFGTTSNSSTNSRFYVFIRASILRDAMFHDLKAISRDDIDDAGVDDGRPTLDPLWIH